MKLFSKQETRSKSSRVQNQVAIKIHPVKLENLLSIVGKG